MKTRFRRVWCSSCSSMQFAGECGHGRTVAPSSMALHYVLDHLEQLQISGGEPLPMVVVTGGGEVFNLRPPEPRPRKAAAAAASSL